MTAGESGGARPAIQKLAAGGGEARMIARGSLARTFEFEEDGRVYRDEWDPRDTGSLLLVAPTNWTSPPGEPIEASTRDAILDGFWQLASTTGKIARIVEWRPIEKCHVAIRWERGEGGFLARIAKDAIEYLELGRTAFVPAAPVAGATRRAKLGDESAARWRFPADASVTHDDWNRIAANLRGAKPGDMFFSEPGWTIE